MSVLTVHGSLLQVHHLLEYLNKCCLRPRLEDAATLKLAVGAWGLRVWSKRRIESPTDLLSQAFNPPPSQYSSRMHQAAWRDTCSKTSFSVALMCPTPCIPALLLAVSQDLLKLRIQFRLCFGVRCRLEVNLPRIQRPKIKP